MDEGWTRRNLTCYEHDASGQQVNLLQTSYQWLASWWGGIGSRFDDLDMAMRFVEARHAEDPNRKNGGE